jgi:hypothetical protein
MTTARPVFRWTIFSIGPMTPSLAGFQSRDALERRKEILQPTGGVEGVRPEWRLDNA